MSKALAKKAAAGANLPAVYDWEEQARKAAQDQQAAAPAATGGNWMSIRGGNFTYKNESIPGKDGFEAIVLAVAYENAYYLHKFSQESRNPPACFAVGLDAKALKPHESSPKKQGDDEGNCAGCWANAFGTGEGRGKACGNRIRLAFAPAEDILGGKKSDEEIEIALIRIPPTSMKLWTGYMARLSRANIATFQVSTKMTLEQPPGSPPSGLLVHKMVGDGVRDKASQQRILRFREQALEDIQIAYDVTGFDEATANIKRAPSRATKGRSAAAKAAPAAAPRKSFGGAGRRTF